MSFYFSALAVAGAIFGLAIVLAYFPEIRRAWRRWRRSRR